MEMAVKGTHVMPLVVSKLGDSGEYIKKLESVFGSLLALSGGPEVQIEVNSFLGIPGTLCHGHGCSERGLPVMEGEH